MLEVYIIGGEDIMSGVLVCEWISDKVTLCTEFSQTPDQVLHQNGLSLR